MADKTPLKALFTGPNVTSLAEMGTGDTVGVAHGGTGRTDGGNLIPAGGTSGQVLAKTSGSDYAIGWTTPSTGATDADRQNGLLNWIYQSKLYAGYRRGISLFADGFKASDGINAGSSSNYTLDTAGGVITPSTPTTILNPSASASTDSAYTRVSRDAVLPAGAVITKLGIFAATGATFSMKIVLRNSAGNYTVVVNESLVHPGGGWADLTLSSPYTVPGSGLYYAACGAPSGAINFSAATATGAFILGNATGTTAGWTEYSGNVVFPLRYTLQTQNMTLVSSSQTVPSSTKNRLLVEYDGTATPTLNTDLTVELSCNGGTNYTTATLTAAGVGQSGRLVAETNEATCTSGTSALARIKTLNNKNIPIYGVAFQVKT